MDAGCGAGNLAIAISGLLYRRRTRATDRRRRDDDFVVLGGVRDDMGEESGGEEDEDDEEEDHRCCDVRVLAVDVNRVALDRLDRRSSIANGSASVRTLCADLADDRGLILSCIPPADDVVVTSLHACGSASDYAMDLAFDCDSVGGGGAGTGGAPFVICPCCTAKSLTRRADVDYGDGTARRVVDDGDRMVVTGTMRNIRDATSSSKLRSGAAIGIEYPRSFWLRDKFTSMQRGGDEGADRDGDSKAGGGGGSGGIGIERAIGADDVDDAGSRHYAILAKAADVGLGPQTPARQRENQRRAKRIVELDRAMRAVEQYGYVVRLARIVADGDDNDNDRRSCGYGKGEVLVGARRGSAAAANIVSILP